MLNNKVNIFPVNAQVQIFHYVNRTINQEQCEIVEVYPPRPYEGINHILP